MKLLFRSANKLGENIWKNFENNRNINNNIDYMWNKIQFSKENLRKISYDFFNAILRENREDLLEDFFIFYYDTFEQYPEYIRLIPYIIENINKPIIKKYISLLNDTNTMEYRIIIDILENGDINTSINIFEKQYPLMPIAYKTFLENNEFNIENYKLFLKSFKYSNGIFVVYQKDIFIIDGYDRLKNEFILRNKIGKTKNVIFKDIIIKTQPLEKNDFRVYKFFKPEEGKKISPCELLKLILKYKKSAMDRDELKKELLYIWGKDVNKWMLKNKTNFENCNDIEIIYGKKERYMLSDENKGLESYIKRLNNEEKVRDYLLSVKSKRDFTDNEKRIIKDYVKNSKSMYSLEIGFLLGESPVFDSIESIDISIFKYTPFILFIIKEKIKNNYIDDTLIKNMYILKEIDIESLYKLKNDKFNGLLVKEVEKELRIGKNIYFLKWYLMYHIYDNLLIFDIKHITIRILQIANDIFMNNKSHDFIVFIRKFLLSGKEKFIIALSNKLSKKEYREIFDIFIQIKFLNDYKKDEIRKSIYDKYQDFRVFEKIDYDFSTKESIMAKQKEMDSIIKDQLPKLIKVIGEAAELGDLSENAEYKYSRERYRFLSSEVDRIKKELSKAVPIDFSLINGDKVNYGTKIVIENIDEKKQYQYIVLGPLDTNIDNGIISYKSPLVEKIMGKREGDIVDNIKIVKIEKYYV